MKSRAIFFTFTILIIFQTLCVASDYFPLEVGNSWVYRLKGLVNGQDSFNIDKVIVVEEKEYFHMRNRYYRKDNTGKVYISSGDSLDTDSQSEAVMYDFGANVGDSWKSILYRMEYTITLESISETVETLVGTFHNCYKFSFKAPENTADADFSRWLAPDIGEVQGTGSFMLFILEEATINGVKIETSVTEESNNTPFPFEVINFPNPFNASTSIYYSLPQNAHTLLDVYSTTGKKITTLVNEPMNAGKYSINFNGDGLPSGVYFYRLKTGNHEKTGRMLLVK